MKYALIFICVFFVLSENLPAQKKVPDKRNDRMLAIENLTLTFSEFQGKKFFFLLDKKRQKDTITIFPIDTLKKDKGIEFLQKFSDTILSYISSGILKIEELENVNSFFNKNIPIDLHNRVFLIDTFKILRIKDSIFIFKPDDKAIPLYTITDTTKKELIKTAQTLDDLLGTHLEGAISAVIDDPPPTFFKKLLNLFKVPLPYLLILFVLTTIIFIRWIKIEKKHVMERDKSIEILNDALNEKFPSLKEIKLSFAISDEKTFGNIDNVFTNINNKAAEWKREKELDKNQIIENKKLIESFRTESEGFKTRIKLLDNRIIEADNKITLLNQDVEKGNKVIEGLNYEIINIKELYEKKMAEASTEMEIIGHKITQMLDKDLANKIGGDIYEDARVQPILLAEMLKVAILTSSYFKVKLNRYNEDDMVNVSLLKGNENFQISKVVDENSGKHSVPPYAYHLYKIIQQVGIESLGKVSFYGYKIGR